MERRSFLKSLGVIVIAPKLMVTSKPKFKIPGVFENVQFTNMTQVKIGLITCVMETWHITPKEFFNRYQTKKIWVHTDDSVPEQIERMEKNCDTKMFIRAIVI